MKTKVTSEITVGSLGRWFGVCPHCRHALPPLEMSAPQYFAAGTVECIECHASVDLWECARSQINDDFPPEWGLLALGAQCTLFPIEVVPGTVIPIDLTRHGVPEDAVLLYSSYQADDVLAILRPLELYSKELAQNPKHQAVYCMPVRGQPTDPAPGRAFVSWIERGADAHVSLRIANAFRDLASHDFAGVTVEAFSAFEVALFALVSLYIDKHCSSNALKQSIERRLSAYWMIQELLPKICQELAVRPLNKGVIQGLHRLRECRNKLLHRGIRQPVNASLAGEFLATALIGVAFVRHLRP